jgi:hypothetical protein
MQYIDILERIKPIALRPYRIAIVGCICMAILIVIVWCLVSRFANRNGEQSSLLSKIIRFGVSKRKIAVIVLCLLTVSLWKGFELFTAQKEIEADIIGRDFSVYEGEIFLMNHGNSICLSDLDVFVEIVEFDESWNHALDLSESTSVRVVYGKNSLIVVKIEPLSDEVDS